MRFQVYVWSESPRLPPGITELVQKQQHPSSRGPWAQVLRVRVIRAMPKGNQEPCSDRLEVPTPPAVLRETSCGSSPHSHLSKRNFKVKHDYSTGALPKRAQSRLL